MEAFGFSGEKGAGTLGLHLLGLMLSGSTILFLQAGGTAPVAMATTAVQVGALGALIFFVRQLVYYEMPANRQERIEAAQANRDVYERMLSEYRAEARVAREFHEKRVQGVIETFSRHTDRIVEKLDAMS